MGVKLRVAVIHYHLKRGGVTRVIENTKKAFQETGLPVELAAVVGEAAAPSPLDATAIVPGLAYNQNPEPMDAAILENEVRAAAARLLEGPPDLWHIHNHSLGKNANMAGLVGRFAESGDPLLLQIHDFAEDNRPENYRLIRAAGDSWRRLYPVAPQIGYAVLNGRDRDFLAAAGIPDSSLFSLPNPVPHPPPEADEPPLRLTDLDPTGTFGSLVLYPVRATRRKNLGELALWAALYSNHSDIPEPLDRPLFVSTLGATNPNFESRYERWRAYGEKENLPIRFGIAESGDLPFEAIMATADVVISTSVAEGFGLGFLEPWTYGKPLVGRDLPEVTRDFRKHDIRLDELYERIDIPLEWCGNRNSVRDHLLVHMKRSYQHYGQELSLEHLHRATESILEKDRVDFGRLDEPLQCRIIDTLLQSRDARRELARVLLPEPASPEKIETNRRRILEAYSPVAYGQELNFIYQALLNAGGPSHAVSFVEPEAVLKEFLDPYRFNLLRA